MSWQRWRPSLPGALTAAALVAFVVWFASATEWVEVDLPRMQVGPIASDDLYVLKKVLQPIGARVVERDDLSELPPPGATLLLREWSWGLLRERDKALRDWVERGGNLVIESRLLGWRGESRASWIPIEFDQRPPRKKAPAPTADKKQEQREREIRALVPRALPRCHKVAEPEGVPVAYSGGLSLCIVGSMLRTRQQPLWALAGEDGGNDLLRVAVGAGSVTAVGGLNFGSFSVFGNPSILEDDNALAAMAALQAHRGAEIWLISGNGAPPLLAWLWDRGRVAVLLSLLALALWLWRATARFGPIQAAPPPARRSMREQIAGTAAFLWHRGPQALHAAQVRALDEAAALRLRHYARLDRIDRAAAIGAATGVAPAALERALNPAAAKSPHALARMLALLEAARRRLTISPEANR